MNHLSVYKRLIAKAAYRIPPKEYTEEHHIIPECLGGKDTPDNMVALTAREHYVAHLLLSKIYGGRLWHAAFWMGACEKRQSSRMYSKAREEHCKLQSEVGYRVGKELWANKAGMFSISKDEWKKQTRNAGLKTVEMKVGLYGRNHDKIKQDASKAGKAGSLSQKMNKTGGGYLYPELYREVGLKCKELGLGFHAEGVASKGGSKTKELGVGIFAMTKEQRRPNGLALSKIKVMCSCGLTSNPGAIARHKKATGHG